jgi:hypothetical protein
MGFRPSFAAFPGRLVVGLLALAMFAPFSLAEGGPQIALDTSETLFAVLTAINSCGYDQDLTASDPLRSNIRAEVQKNLKASDEAQAASTALCDYYQAHRGQDASRDLSQYVSLALYLQGPPHFLPKVKEDELPPDAEPIAGFAAALEHFYDKAGLHGIWERHKGAYAALADRYHEPLAKMVFDTEIYLKLPSSGYLGQSFTIYLDVMGSPSQINARNYGADYDVVIFPPAASSESSLRMDQIRHTYLHYLLDPLAAKYAGSVKRLQPLLEPVKRSALDDSFKTDISLLVTECLVRAIEIRTTGTKQIAEAMRAQAVDDAVKQGFILTRYFYDALTAFEKDPAGIRNDYAGFLDNMDVKREARAPSEVQFASAAAPELLQQSRMEERRMLVTAEKRLAAGDTAGAQQLAQQALDRKIGDPGRAQFILAEAAVANKNMVGALDYFQKAIDASKEPKVVAWSHVYLGRIFDLKDERESAMDQYRAALSSGDALPEIKDAAQRGLDAPYEPPETPAPVVKK